MNSPQWDNLILDESAVPTPLDEGQFGDWMARHRFFVSSTMDDEMTPFRNAVRGWLIDMGSPPVMWEELTPRDERSDVTYLEGVDRSDRLILLLGTRYGVTDSTGYSPIHKEANHARSSGPSRVICGERCEVVACAARSEECRGGPACARPSTPSP